MGDREEKEIDARWGQERERNSGGQRGEKIECGGREEKEIDGRGQRREIKRWGRGQEEKKMMVGGSELEEDRICMGKRKKKDNEWRKETNRQ